MEWTMFINIPSEENTANFQHSNEVKGLTVYFSCSLKYLYKYYYMNPQALPCNSYKCVIKAQCRHFTLQIQFNTLLGVIIDSDI